MADQHETTSLDSPEPTAQPRQIDMILQKLNEQDAFCGMNIRYSKTRIAILGGGLVHEWIECSIHCKDRTHPFVAREYMQEALWQEEGGHTHPNRILRWAAITQAARMAFNDIVPPPLHRIDQADSIENSAANAAKAAILGGPQSI
ncbi:MAG: hypothetical protein CME59_22505 [Halioglobus sp.]|nr:hypothetical protein [Halioglobus sp.]|tara:strand:- start:552 stop:989 length:438 start_codon:yes stop_codon:yes gene_type:complete